MKNWTDNRFINLPKNYTVWTGSGWSFQRMNKALHRLKKRGFFTQEGRYEFVRTELTQKQYDDDKTIYVKKPNKVLKKMIENQQDLNNE